MVARSSCLLAGALAMGDLALGESRVRSNQSCVPSVVLCPERVVAPQGAVETDCFTRLCMQLR